MRIARNFSGLLICCLVLAGCKTGELVTDSQTALADKSESTASQRTTTPDIAAGQRPDPSSDEAGLWLMVDRSEARTKTSGDRIRDPALNAYVRQIVCDLAGPHCGDIRVYIARVPHFNATMSPNGMMVVWSGLLLRVRNEAQLATVLGHEIGHYLRRHGVERFRRIRDTYGFLAFMSMGMAMVGIPLITDIAAIAAQGGLSSYNRSDETEADAIGLTKISEAGYHPGEAALVWDNVIKEHEVSGEEKQFSLFLSSHPRPEDRREELTNRAESILRDTTTVKLDRHTERYRANIAPWRQRLLRDEVRRHQYKRSIGLIDMLIEDGYRVGELHYFKGEVYRLRDDTKLDDRAAALREYDKAAEIGGYPPELHKSRGLLKLRMNDRPGAAASFRQYLDRRPDAPDRNYILSLIKPASGS